MREQRGRPIWKRPADAADLLAEIAGDGADQVTPSVYETARLVALAPWLPGHQARLEFLHRRQRADGGWGGPGGYAVVPTLGATTAILAELRRDRHSQEREQLTRAAKGGRDALRRLLDPQSGTSIPDTIGVELIVPALVNELNSLGGQWQVPLPRGFDDRHLSVVRERLQAGTLSRRAWACLDVFGTTAAGAPSVQAAGGAVCCSAAATAAWVGGPDGDPSGRGFLDDLQARGGGPVPGVNPITFFEPAWVVNNLAVGAVAGPVPPKVVDLLESALTASGAPAAPGLPADADDTAGVISALLRLGRVPSPKSLLGYRSGDHFTCFVDERNPSVSTNAHVLEAFSLYLRRVPDDRDEFAGPAATAARWLLDQQQADGHWLDKWHASAYYATWCCVLALVLHGAKGSRQAVDRAVRWVLQTQRTDGSWGRWQATVEETAYAVQTLALGCADGEAATAIKRGRSFLSDPPPLAEHPALWHAKDLYMPVAVVQAARLAALTIGVNRAGARASAVAPVAAG